MTADLVEQLRVETEKCISCGFCESVCPTLSASDYVSIKGARGRVLLGRAAHNDIKDKGRTELKIADSFYSCLDCYACVHVCPAGVNAGKVSDIAKRVITSGNYTKKDQQKAVAKMIASAIMKHKNPLGLRKESADWAKSFDFDDDSSTLLYTGNMYQLMAYSKSLGNMKGVVGDKFTDIFAEFISKRPSLIKMAGSLYDFPTKESMESALKSIVGLLRKAGIKFRYLGEDEPYPGTFLYDLGYVDLFKKYSTEIFETFSSAGIKRVITIDPHTYDIMKNQYKEYVEGFDLEIIHYLDVLKDLKLKESDEEITFHEPCHFVLRDNDYNIPKNILSKAAKLKMPPRSGRSTMCCGGPNELLFAGIAERVSNERFAELKRTGAQKIITACPICFVNLAKDRSVVDIANFLAEKAV